MTVKEKIEILIEAKDRASSALKGLTGSLGILGKVVGGVALAGFGAAIGGLGATLKSSFEEAAAAEEITAQLQAVLKSTGGVAKVTEKQINDYATSMSQLTKYEDDAIISAQSMLLTFTNIGTDVFDKASTAILNMSTAMGTDLQSSAIQVGKALNDPIEGVSALTRVGVQFTDAQKEMIKALVESGDVVGAQTVILAELEKQFGGSAAAAGQTFNGQMEILKNTLGNVKEEIGTALMPILQEFAEKYMPVIIEGIKQFAEYTITNVIPAVAEMATWFGDKLLPVMMTVGAWIGDVMIPAISTGLSALKPVMDLIIRVAEDVYWIFADIQNESFNWLLLEGGMKRLLETLGLTEEQAIEVNKVFVALGRFWLDTLYPAIVKLGGSINTILVTALAGLRTAWETNFLGIRDVVAGAFKHIQLVFQLFKQIFEGDWRAVGETVRKIWDNIIATWKAVDWVELGRNIIRGIAAGIVALGKWLGGVLLSIVNAAVEMIKGFLGIESPSKVMADRIGKQMILGIGAGFQAGLKKVSTDMQSGLNSIIPTIAPPQMTLAPAFAGSAGGYGNSVIVNYQPAISFADEYELEQRLRPAIEQALRRR